VLCDGLSARGDRGFLDGHVAAFLFFEGASVLLDDYIKIAAARICGDAKRG
jgi:hypothetical protein